MVRRLTRTVRVYPTLTSATAALAREVAECARDCVRARGRFSIVLAGGRTPGLVYQRLARQYRDSIPWAATDVYFGDERAVSPRDPQSNYGSARRELFAGLPIPRRNIHRLDGARRPLSASASQYARLIGPLPGSDTPPRFDLVLLGLGPDGHTASLFPNAPAVRERRRTVVVVRHSGQPPYVPRLTLTVPALSSSREVCLLVSGSEKAAAVAATLRTRGAGNEKLPASLVRPAGVIRWFLDEAAAGELSAGLRTG